MKTEEIRNRVANALYDVLEGQEVMHCTRVWEAWSYGTMSEDDFDLVVNDTAAMEEIIENVVSVFAGEYIGERTELADYMEGIKKYLAENELPDMTKVAFAADIRDILESLGVEDGS